MKGEPADGGISSLERAWVEALVSKSVRVRFALGRDAFVRRVLEVAGARLTPGSDPKRLLGSMALDDLYLASACGGDDEKAWDEMAALHFSFIRDFAMSCARRDPPAGDVAASVIADLWQRGRIRQFSGRSSLRTWLGTVVAHATVNALKQMSRTVPLEDSGGEEAAGFSQRGSAPEDEAMRGELARAAGEAIAGLETSDRLLLLFYYEQGMTLAQIERVVGKSKAALSRRLERVRRELKGAIESKFGPAGAASAEVDYARVGLDLAAVLRAARRESGPGPVSKA